MIQAAGASRVDHVHAHDGAGASPEFYGQSISVTHTSSGSRHTSGVSARPIRQHSCQNSNTGSNACTYVSGLAVCTLRTSNSLLITRFLIRRSGAD